MRRRTFDLRQLTPEEHPIYRKLRHGAFALAPILISIALLSGAHAAAAAEPIEIGTDGFARFEVAPVAGSVTVWIEVEEPGFDADDVVVRLGTTDLASSATALGTIATSVASTSAQTYAVGITSDATPDIAVTVIGAGGTVLYSTSYRLALEDYRDFPQTPAVITPTVDPPSGPLALTGVVIAPAIAAALLAIAFGIVVLRARRTAVAR